MKLAVNNPNFSIITPTGCNASCDFCFWEKPDECNKVQYISKLVSLFNNKPEVFKQCSITGGEPTTLPWLGELLEFVRPKFEKVVMTSNGYDIKDEHLKFIDHLNISRHKVTDVGNSDVFKSDTVPNRSELTKICHNASIHGVDVTLNCVLEPDFCDTVFILDYIQFAKDVGANAVCFRKIHSDLEELPVAKEFAQKRIDEGGCPACLSYSQYIGGIRVTWRYGVNEPNDVMDGVYELVFHPSGQLSSRWDKGDEITFKRVVQPPKEVVRYVNNFSRGCGGSGC
jgi:organic radical activating enzyme